jgi:hypothetical protein
MSTNDKSFDEPWHPGGIGDGLTIGANISGFTVSWIFWAAQRAVPELRAAVGPGCTMRTATDAEDFERHLFWNPFRKVRVELHL